MATKSNPEAIARSMVSSRLMPPSSISGIARAARNCEAFSKKYASSKS